MVGLYGDTEIEGLIHGHGRFEYLLNFLVVLCSILMTLFIPGQDRLRSIASNTVSLVDQRV